MKTLNINEIIQIAGGCNCICWEVAPTWWDDSQTGTVITSVNGGKKSLGCFPNATSCQTACSYGGNAITVKTRSNNAAADVSIYWQLAYVGCY